MKSSSKAFTLMELLVVLFVLSVFVCGLLPMFAGTSSAKSRAFTCLHNQRQIMAATLMYAQDHGDLLPPNPDDGNNIPGHNWCGYSPDNYNPSFLINNCMLMAYLKTNYTLFRCAADSSVKRSPTNPNLFLPIARSISMNQAVGTVCPSFGAGGSGHSGKPVLSVNGPWLDNAHTHHRNSPYRTYGRTSEMIAPTPAQLWVFLEEDTRSMNDAGWAFGARVAEWIDFPTSLHEFGCVFAFADGHTELRKWVDSRTQLKTIARTVVPGSRDWQWMAERTTARAQ